MLSPIYQYVISLVVNLPIRRGPVVFTNVLLVEHHAVNTKLFEVYYPNTIINTTL
jgi:hypothetical protein